MKFFYIFSLFLVSCTHSIESGNSQWYTERGSIGAFGHSKEECNLPLLESWRLDFPDGPLPLNVTTNAEPISGDGKVFYSRSDLIHALDARNGNEIWTFSAPENGCFKTCTYMEFDKGEAKRIFVTSGSQSSIKLFCLEAETGSPIWVKSYSNIGPSISPCCFVSPPTISGNNIYFTMKGAQNNAANDTSNIQVVSRLICVDVNGTEVFNNEFINTSLNTNSPPLTGAGQIYISDIYNNVIKVFNMIGDIKFNITEISSAPLIDNGIIDYTGGSIKYIVADATYPSSTICIYLPWFRRNNYSTIPQPERGFFITAFNQSGAKLWRTEMLSNDQNSTYFGVALSQDLLPKDYLIYAGRDRQATDTGTIGQNAIKVYKIDKSNGSIVWSTHLNETFYRCSAPVIWGSNVFFMFGAEHLTLEALNFHNGSSVWYEEYQIPLTTMVNQDRLSVIGNKLVFYQRNGAIRALESN